MARSVVFFRNLNLGQGWAPTRRQLEAAYDAAGASDVVNVQSNGTVVFTAAAPRRTTDAVLSALHELTGYSDIAVVRSARWVERLAARLGELDVPDDIPSEVVLFDGPAVTPPCPWTSPDGRTRVIAADRQHAVTTFDRTAGRGSNAAAVLEQLTGVRTTARGTATMVRVAARAVG